MVRLHQRAAEPRTGSEYLATRAVRVGKNQSRSDDVESSIDVHRVWVLERDDVDLVVRGQMTPHPLDS